MEPAAISAIPAITTMEVLAMLPESPAARAKGTVNPSAMPMTTSRTTRPEVKWVSTSGGRCGCGCSSFTREEIYHRGSDLVRSGPLDSLHRHLALALIAEFFGSIFQRQPHGMSPFAFHLFLDVADLAAHVFEQVKADDFEYLRPVAA